ncbi:MAG: glycosyltransferase family 2 protein [Candidatus Omnitrophota bacterium]
MSYDVSIIVPVCNEEGNIKVLFDKISLAMPRDLSWQLLIVDDGSTDRSREEIRALCRDKKNVSAILFSKNYGHQIALSAGYDHAEGRAVITMDADLQHPPESLPAMLQLWRDGAEIVFAVRRDDGAASPLKRLTSRWFYALLKAISRIDFIPGAADFRLLDRKAVDHLKLYHERDRFLRGIIGDMGFRRAIYRYDEAPRQHGVSKYGPLQMIRLAITGIVSFSSFPLKLCSTLGFFISIASLLYAGAIIYDKLTRGAPVGIASVLVGVFFIGGVQLIFIGVLGEYLMSVFKEVKARPLYCISEKI